MTSDEATVRAVRPGWPELLAGAVAYLVAFAVVFWLLPLVEDEAVGGVFGLVASGLMGTVAFAAAWLVRVRRFPPFGVRRARGKYFWMALGLGVAAYALGVIGAIVYTLATGDDQNVQTGYQAAAGSGWLFLAVALIAGSVITPVGEELFFRGVVANVLLARWNVWIAVPVSAAVFALAHGINPVLPVAFVVGVLTALLLRWSGSIWPGVVLHAVNNTLAFLVPVVVTALS